MDHQARILPTRDMLRRMPHELSDEIDVEGIELMLNLLTAADGVRSRVSAQLAAFDLSEGKFSLLMALFGEGPMGTLKLSERIGVKPSTVSVMVKRMTADGEPLVAVATGEADRRERVIALTSAGRRRVEAALPGHLAELRRFSSQLQADERENLIRLLQRLQKA
jgi:MarR family transcriptional regulator, negative regulator of the multidrug operon emrRAB